jgi:hypothetical protein
MNHNSNKVIQPVRIHCIIRLKHVRSYGNFTLLLSLSPSYILPKINPVLMKIKNYRNKWVQHVWWMERDRLPCLIMKYQPCGKRSQGWQLKRLLDSWWDLNRSWGLKPCKVYDDNDDDDDDDDDDDSGSTDVLSESPQLKMHVKLIMSVVSNKNKIRHEKDICINGPEVLDLEQHEAEWRE